MHRFRNVLCLMMILSSGLAVADDCTKFFDVAEEHFFKGYNAIKEGKTREDIISELSDELYYGGDASRAGYLKSRICDESNAASDLYQTAMTESSHAETNYLYATVVCGPLDAATAQKNSDSAYRNMSVAFTKYDNLKKTRSTDCGGLDYERREFRKCSEVFYAEDAKIGYITMPAEANCDGSDDQVKAAFDKLNDWIKSVGGNPLGYTAFYMSEYKNSESKYEIIEAMRKYANQVRASGKQLKLVNTSSY